METTQQQTSVTIGFLQDSHVRYNKTVCNGKVCNHICQHLQTLAIFCRSTRWRHFILYQRQHSNIVAALHRASMQWKKSAETTLAFVQYIGRINTQWQRSPSVSGVAVLHRDVICWFTRWQQLWHTYGEFSLERAPGCRTKLIVVLSRANDDSVR